MKGSTIEREASDKELDKSLPTLKDNDFIKQGIRVKIGEVAKQKLNEILTADVEVGFLNKNNTKVLTLNFLNLQFLTKLHLMDYSVRN